MKQSSYSYTIPNALVKFECKCYCYGGLSCQGPLRFLPLLYGWPSTYHCTQKNLVFLFYFSFLIFIKSYIQLLPYSQVASTALHAGFGRFLCLMPFLMQTLKRFVFPTRTGLGSFSLLNKCANHNTINNLNYS